MNIDHLPQEAFKCMTKQTTPPLSTVQASAVFNLKCPEVVKIQQKPSKGKVLLGVFRRPQTKVRIVYGGGAPGHTCDQNSAQLS